MDNLEALVVKYLNRTFTSDIYTLRFYVIDSFGEKKDILLDDVYFDIRDTFGITGDDAHKYISYWVETKMETLCDERGKKGMKKEELRARANALIGWVHKLGGKHQKW